MCPIVRRQVPLIGAFCNGEIGPYVRAGYAGWAQAGCALPDPTSQPCAGGGIAAAAAAAAATGDGGNAGSSISLAPSSSESTVASSAVLASGGGNGGGNGGERALLAAAGGGDSHGDSLLPPSLDACRMQGWTSMYAMLS
jgi:hypothetical protein